MLKRWKRVAPLDTSDEDEMDFHATNTVAEKMPKPPHGACGLLADPADVDGGES